MLTLPDIEDLEDLRDETKVSVELICSLNYSGREEELSTFTKTFNLSGTRRTCGMLPGRRFAPCLAAPFPLQSLLPYTLPVVRRTMLEVSSPTYSVACELY